jgi:hypothetical protein
VTPITATSIDNSACTEWADGAEKPCPNPVAIRQLFWTQTTQPATVSVPFGLSTQPGLRHLRIGFNAPLAVGSILIRGGDAVSVLRANAAYPGNIADESQWIPAKRIVNRQISSAEVDMSSYALWVLPAGTSTRALRFTHVAEVTDASYVGTIGALYLLSDRLANLAPQASIFTSTNSHAAPLLIDEKDGGWATWDNGPDFAHPITPQHPEWIMLTFPRPVSLRGLAALWAGFNGANTQIYTGPDNIKPQEAPESAWQSIGSGVKLHNQYPRSLGVDWMDFGKTITTRGIRLQMTEPTDESHHPHLVGHTHNGSRIWLGELMALTPLGTSDLATAIPPAITANVAHPPIPVHFNMPSAGFVTLVINDDKGNRVRNLVSDTWLEAGANTAWWDGTDDLGRNADAALHGVYLIPTHFVSPGHYSVQGIYHKTIDLHYEFSVYNAGHPAWDTADGKGGWLTNHTPPSSALFVPADKAPGGKPLVYLGSYVSEGGAGLAWVDLDGHKQGGRGWVGGGWTGAAYLARDSGTHADASTYAYVAAPWSADTNKDPKHPLAIIRLTALTNRGDRAIPSYSFDPAATQEYDDIGRAIFTHQMAGLAVRDNLVVLSLTLQNKLVFLDAATGKVVGNVSAESPRGVSFDAQGRLLVLSGKHLLRYPSFGPANQARLDGQPKPQILVADKLEDPMGITVDGSGNIYISDRGESHQVKVFTESGSFVRAIGHPGEPKAGPYDALHVNNPKGLAIDSSNHLWVTEEDFQPKRVSVWTLDGKLVNAFYGPAEYGGGGTLDPKDKARFYYHGMEFKLDWNAGTDTLASVLYRPSKDDLPLPPFSYPGTVLYRGGHRYFTNCYTAHGTSGTSIAMLFLDKDGVIQPVAAVGKANTWALLKDPSFKSQLPQGVDLSSPRPQDETLFSWSDSNGNGKVDPGEVVFQKTSTGWMTVMPDLSIDDEFVDGKVMEFAPVQFTPSGVPVYDIHKGQVLADGAQRPASDGGGQILHSAQATVMTTAPKPFAPESIGGIDSKGHRWSYPSLWPGLHPSHSAPLPDRTGMLTGTTHLLGGLITPKSSQAGPLWAINSNFGEIYLFTADGLFVTQLFQDVRSGKPWTMPTASRNMLLNEVSLFDENFFPSITQTPDGNVYLVDGRRTSLVRVDGLDSINSLPPSPLEVTAEELKSAHAGMVQTESARQQIAGPKTLAVTIRAGTPPALNGLTEALAASSWAAIDHRITRIGWNDHPDLSEAAITIAGGRLFAAFRTNDPKLLINSGTVTNAPFKTGGALDLMIGADPKADPKRISPVAGDIRLLVYLVSGKPHALLYRAIIAGPKTPVPFSSPDRTVTFDQVTDVTTQIDFNATGGDYQFSIPLQTLGLRPVAGEKIKADIGILRGNGTQTSQRVYWSNKATGITADVPSEAELTPNLWGEWTFVADH